MYKKSLKLFADLKKALVSAPILAFPNFKLPFFIQCDASNNGIGGVLLQFIDGFYKPIAFASRKLSDTENRYTATERELLALVYCYDQFYSHEYGGKIKFFTDHEPIVTMSKLKKPHGRLGRLFHRLQDADHEISYLPGSLNYLPDFLSRSFAPNIQAINTNLTEVQSAIDWELEQSKDSKLSEIINSIRSDAPDSKWLLMTNGRRWLT
jgi:hypothetical protein